VGDGADGRASRATLGTQSYGESTGLGDAVTVTLGAPSQGALTTASHAETTCTNTDEIPKFRTSLKPDQESAPSLGTSEDTRLNMRLQSVAVPPAYVRKSLAGADWHGGQWISPTGLVGEPPSNLVVAVVTDSDPQAQQETSEGECRSSAVDKKADVAESQVELVHEVVQRSRSTVAEVVDEGHDPHEDKPEEDVRSGSHRSHQSSPADQFVAELETGVQPVVLPEIGDDGNEVEGPESAVERKSPVDKLLEELEVEHHEPLTNDRASSSRGEVVVFDPPPHDQIEIVDPAFVDEPLSPVEERVDRGPAADIDDQLEEFASCEFEEDTATFRVHCFFGADIEKLGFEVEWTSEAPVVTRVKPTGEAQKRGLVVGDELFECNNKPMMGEKRKTGLPHLKERPLLLKVDRTRTVSDPKHPRLELSYRLHSPANDYGIDLYWNERMPVISCIRPQSPAWVAGLLQGDGIVAIGGQDTMTVSVRTVRCLLDGRKVDLTIWRRPVDCDHLAPWFDDNWVRCFAPKPVVVPHTPDRH